MTILKKDSANNKWSKDDEVIGNRFLEEVKGFDPNLSFIARMDLVAKQFLYNGYRDQSLAGVRSFIASHPKQRKERHEESKNERVICKKNRNPFWRDVYANPDKVLEGLAPDEDLLREEILAIKEE